MASTPSRKYLRAVELAKQRGYASPYEERKARAQQRGFSSPRTEGKARENQRDYQLERERANIRANARGFRNTREQARFNREAKANPTLDREAWQKANTLAYFGISESKFNRIRRANREWHEAYPLQQWSAINTYNIDTDRNVHNWSERRVGYILAFYAAVVNPKTNWESLTKRVSGYNHEGKKFDRQVRKTEKGKKVTNKEQFYYLVKYTNLMQVDEFEARYGRNIVRSAENGRLEV